MQDDIVSQGLELMLFGMGTVVLFLALLVLATAAMSRFITRWLPESTAAVAMDNAEGLKNSGSQGLDDPNIVAAIGAAIHRYRHDRQ